MLRAVVTLIVDTDALATAISDFPGGKEMFVELLAELGRLNKEVQAFLLGETKGFSVDERVEWFTEERPAEAARLIEVFNRIDEIRRQIREVLEGTFVREQLLNSFVPDALKEASQAGDIHVGPLELSAPESRLRVALAFITNSAT